MNNMQNLGLLTLRAGVGGVLLAHGVQKLFRMAGGCRADGHPPAMRSSGWDSGPACRAPSQRGWVRPAEGHCSCWVFSLRRPVQRLRTMIPAAAVLAPKGFFATGGGYEYPALLGLSATALALTGPGDWPLDARLGQV